jgi:putative membrane protein
VVAWLLASHIFGLVLWISGLLVTTMALSRHTQETSPEARQALARLERLYLRALADTGALVAILAGIGLITTSPDYYLHAGWLHMKLTLVVGVVGLHGFIAARTKAFAAGRIKLERGQARLLTVAILIIFLLILIVTLPVRVAMS